MKTKTKAIMGIGSLVLSILGASIANRLAYPPEMVNYNNGELIRLTITGWYFNVTRFFHDSAPSPSWDRMQPRDRIIKDLSFISTTYTDGGECGTYDGQDYNGPPELGPTDNIGSISHFTGKKNLYRSTSYKGNERAFRKADEEFKRIWEIVNQRLESGDYEAVQIDLRSVISNRKKGLN